MLVYMYFFTFIISLLLLAVLVARYKNKVSLYYTLLFTSVMLSTFGSMQMANSKDVMTAIFANQTNYLGACFSPFFLIMCMADLCKVKIKHCMSVLFAIFASVVFACVSTTGYSQLYYRNVSMVTDHGVTFLVKDNGPLHVIWPMYLIFMCIAGITMIINAMKRRKEVSYISSICLLLCILIPVGLYVIEKLMHFEVELLPFAYLISQTICLLLVRRIRLYEVSALSATSILESHNMGFILCNDAGKYLGSDDTAKIWFPEIDELLVDKPIDCECSDLFIQIKKWLNKDENRDTVYIERNNMIIEVSHTILKERLIESVHCIYLKDETEQQNYTKLVQEYNSNLERDVSAKTKKLRKVQSDIIVSMASIVENRDSNTGGHIARTSDIIKIFVDHLKKKKSIDVLTPEIAACIIKAAPLHDFGKIGIPDVVLNKPGKFTDEEYEIMKQHSAKGAVIVEQILRHSDDVVFRNIAINVAHYHHEKWDGRGYPDGLSGIDIPFEARVMALADVFDALVSKRVYKDSFSYDKAFDIIRESRGSHFDPVLCDEFLECRPQLEALYDSYTD